LQQSREDLVYNAAIRDGVDCLLFLDDDHTFPADVVHHLLARFAARPDVHAIGANYVQRALNTRFITRDLEGKLVMTYPSSTGLEEVRYIGLGVAMIRGEVFRKVPEPWFDFEWSKKPGQNGRPYIERSEDVFMFDTIREHGYGCYVDHDLSKHVAHLGEFGYNYVHGLPDDYKVSILEEDDHK
jgi:cellulose synthase/poly-beta-1,6-N-acetylglucosamine synthase-like glycosyltransferase